MTTYEEAVKELDRLDAEAAEAVCYYDQEHYRRRLQEQSLIVSELQKGAAMSYCEICSKPDSDYSYTTYNPVCRRS